MARAIHAVLDRLREDALDERDKGSEFEQLIRAYLTTDPEWTTHHQFTRRIVFDTAAGWSANAEETLAGGVAQRVDIGYLADAAIDWSQFSWTTPEIVVPTGKKALRPHQQHALDDVRTGLAEHDRGQLVMACGTGTTFTSPRIAGDLIGAGGTVLFLVPSIQLLSQSLREWMANAEVDIRALAVCSDTPSSPCMQNVCNTAWHRVTPPSGYPARHVTRSAGWPPSAV
ncbi:Restriction endonuclease [Modestobacter sp. DSM 44400]|uniref:DEAD/DEAH box helicase family protein n=1 Tax=Modestobacter sp. DSM 44400 TaxID=1550230 RepID=UPI00089AD62C|nr:DEAD/DEAH box helicase family protein [Modestobacter sp. DSM 44400]SDY46618.1 Restriction endonuclease [Modestobacter sp. DSM 44400]